MAAYFLVDILEIKDAAKMERYRSQVPPVVEKFGGRYLVIGGPFHAVKGSYRTTFSGPYRILQHGRRPTVVRLR